jgi:tetratricopeptide (TPR) repeat protein
MIIRLGLCGGVAALAATLLLAPGTAAAQGVLNMANQSRETLGGPAAGPTLQGQFGPNAQDAPPQSVLQVRSYDRKWEYARGFTLLQLGLYSDAASDFENAMDVSPDTQHHVDLDTLSTHPKEHRKDQDKIDSSFLMNCLYMLGVAKSGEGDLAGALQAYEQAMKIDPKQISVRREYAVTLARLGQRDEAQAQFAILKGRADACGKSCAQADDLLSALARVQAALAQPA